MMVDRERRLLARGKHAKTRKSLEAQAKNDEFARKTASVRRKAMVMTFQLIGMGGVRMDGWCGASARIMHRSSSRTAFAP
jgi:hypothetical protein